MTPQDITGPLIQSVGNFQNSVLLGLRLCERVEAFPEPTELERTRLQQLRLDGHITEITQSKAFFKRWIIEKGFEEINTCLREALERVHVFMELRRLPQGTSVEEVDRVKTDAVRRAQRSNFPQLVELINTEFGAPLQQQVHLETINNARNVLIHTQGIVTAQHCNTPSADKLVIKVRRFKLLWKRDDTVLDVPVQIGVPGPENAALIMGAEDADFLFNIGEEISVSLDRFMDILNTVVFVWADLEETLKRFPYGTA